MTSTANLFRLSTSELNVNRISNIEQCFGDNGIPLLRTGRVLIAEGVLLKVCRKKPKKRQFFLFNDLLVYGNIIISRKKYTKQQIIELDDVRAKLLPDDEKAFQVISPKKSFTVYTNTALEADKWVEYINKYAGDCTEAQDSGQHQLGASGVSEAAPVWIPDKAQQSCMICRAGFTVINRRHHCRRCGQLVCQSCSNRKWLLPAQSNKPVRVCATCHAGLQQQQLKPEMPQQPQQQQQQQQQPQDSPATERRVSADAAASAPSIIVTGAAVAAAAAAAGSSMDGGSSTSDCDSD